MKKLVLTSLIAVCHLALAAAPQMIGLWDGRDMPGSGAEKPLQSVGREEDDTQSITNVSVPDLAFYRADTQKPAPAVIICPGGAYGGLAYGKEGTQLAKYLNRTGVSAFVLKYRVPQNREGAYQDAQRALRLVRFNAREWNIDPYRVGMCGFSAGAHLSARTASNYRDEIYPPADNVDKMSSKPDFTVLIYPAYIGNGDLKLNSDIVVDAQTPQTFIAMTMDDNRASDGLSYLLALRASKVHAEAHFFAEGGHGYGMREKQELPLRAWPGLLSNWLKSRGIAGD